jgi:hypothetical protein
MTALAPDQSVLWQPHHGPQSTFLASPAYEALYGGAAGGGKSDALLFGGLRQIDHPHYKALILRRTYPELRELMDRALEVMGQIGGTWNESGKRWTFHSGATLEFGYCDVYADVMRYQGQSYTYIAFDEIGQLKDEKVWTYLMSRNRAAHDGLSRYMRASANPGGPGHQWLKRRFINCCSPDGTPHAITLDDGTIVTRAFVRARLADNPTLGLHDPGYGARLRLLPELEYRWLADGDWDAGAGLGLAELSRDRHLVRPLATIPGHWTLFGAFDWGYQHPFCFGLFCVDEGGTVYLVDSIFGRHLGDTAIIYRVKEMLDRLGYSFARLASTHAGHDCWSEIKARDFTPSTFEECMKHGWILTKANTARIAGVQNFRRYLTWKTPEGGKIEPRFKMCDTPNNRRVFECLEGVVSDPDDPEDILKVDADDQGQGGDDAYDMVRYGLASRPVLARVPAVIPSKIPDRAQPLVVKDGKLIPPAREPRTIDELLKWAEQKKTGDKFNRTPYRQNVPPRR